MKADTFPNIITERLLLNKIETSDRQNIYKGLSMPEVIQYYGVNYSSLEAIDEQMNWYSNLEKSKSGLWWAIRLKGTKEFCGTIGFNDYQKEHRKAELGFWLLPKYWKKGFIQESADSIITYLFKQLEIHRLEAFVEAENKNSSSALLKLGFKHEGKMVDSEIKKGQYISIDLYALLNPDK